MMHKAMATTLRQSKELHSRVREPMKTQWLKLMTLSVFLCVRARYIN